MRRGLSFLRRLSRWGVVGVFCALPWLNAAGLHGISGSLFALDIFGWPFGDPVALLQVLASGERPAAGLLWGGGSSLALAFFMGRVFCGWICPYGLLSEGVAALGMRARAACVSGRGEFAARLVVLTAGMLLVWCGVPALTLLSFPGTISLAPLFVRLDGVSARFFDLLVIPGMALILEALTGERLWCRFVCPQGLLLGCAAWLGRLCQRRGAFLPLSVHWHSGRCSCKGESPCRAVCTLRLQPRRKEGPDALRCSRCGDCIEVCAQKGRALRWKD